MAASDRPNCAVWRDPADRTVFHFGIPPDTIRAGIYLFSLKAAQVRLLFGPSFLDMLFEIVPGKGARDASIVVRVDALTAISSSYDDDEDFGFGTLMPYPHKYLLLTRGSGSSNEDR